LAFANSWRRRLGCRELGWELIFIWVRKESSVRSITRIAMYGVSDWCCMSWQLASNCLTGTQIIMNRCTF
jgi:hypothetical protein